MPVINLAGAKFTVKVATTDRSAQITSGSLNRTANVVRTKTLGPNTITTATDKQDDMSCDFLYDEAAGFYKALYDATESLSSIAVEIVGGTGKWTGDVYIESLGTEFAADGVATCSASMSGTLTFAATTP